MNQTASPTPASSPLMAPSLTRRMACWLYEGMLMFGVVFIAGYLFSTLTQTRNALDKLQDAVAAAGIEPELSDPRKFAAPLDPQSVHQGAALEVKPLDWGRLEDIALAGSASAQSGARASPLPGMRPSPRQSASAGTKTFPSRRSAVGLPSGHTARR